MERSWVQEVRALSATGRTKLSSSTVAGGAEQVRVLRMVLGAMGVFLPSALVLGDWLFLEGSAVVRGSISAYYYSGMRDILVGCLGSIGLFLITYRILDRHLENLLSTVAGVSAILVAVLPTHRPPGEAVPATPLQQFFGEVVVSRVHLGAGIVFIVVLVVISLLFGLREQGWSRHLILVCTGGMVVSLLASAVLSAFVDHYLLIGEAGSVLFFGMSWMLKALVQ